MNICIAVLGRAQIGLFSMYNLTSYGPGCMIVHLKLGSLHCSYNHRDHADEIAILHYAGC